MVDWIFPDLKRLLYQEIWPLRASLWTAITCGMFLDCLLWLCKEDVITSSLPDMENGSEHGENITFPLMVPFWPEAAAFAKCIHSKGDPVHTKEIQMGPFVLMIIGVSSANKHVSVLIASGRVLPLDHPPPSLLTTHLLLSSDHRHCSHLSSPSRKNRPNQTKQLCLPVWRESAGKGMKSSRPLVTGVILD